MGKYIVTSGSYYKPFTYEELVRPLQQMTDAQNATQDAYDTLSAETSALRRYISEEGAGDTQARKIYDSYVQKLNALQENLWANGYNASTRRELSAAREGYFGDITRLSKAIQNRQERSKAYWDLKHAHPDMILGADPGISGLDNYLNNDTFGQDYYSYSGNQFAAEVSADAKARAGELLKNMDERTSVIKDPELKGYLTQIINKGYTSDEVMNASAAVRAAIETGDRDSLNNLPVAEKILADVLISHLDSTGAREKVSADEFNRLFEYGKAGLSQAIGTPQVQNLNDKEYDYQQQRRLASMKSSGSSTKKGDKKEESNGRYFWSKAIQNLTSPGYNALAKSMSGQMKKYENGPVRLNTGDSQSQDIEGPWEMAQVVYNPDIRQKVRRLWGFDLALPATENGRDNTRQTGQIRLADGSYREEYLYPMTAQEANDLGIDAKDGMTVKYKKDGKLVVDVEATKQYNKALQQYRDHVQNMKDLNPDVKNWNKVAITPEQELKYRKDYNIDKYIDSSDVGNILNTTEVQGDYTAATYAAANKSHKIIREDLATEMASTYHYATTGGSEVGKGSPLAFYQVGQGGMTRSTKGETDLGKILGRNKDGSIRDDTILSSDFSVFDVAAGAGNGRPRMTITTSVADGAWSTDASYAGSLLYNALKAVRFPGEYNWQNMGELFGITPPNVSGANPWSACDAAYFLMMPILDSSKVLRMSNEQSALWGSLMYEMLNDPDAPINSAADIVGPVYSNGSDIRLVGAKDIVRDRNLKSQLIGAVEQYIDSVLSVPREQIVQQPMQGVSSTSTHPTTYLGN